MAKDLKKDMATEMTTEEAKAYRASLYKPQKVQLTGQQKREQFRIFWAKSRKQYGSKTTGIEKILWMHMLATGHDEPEKFEKGLQHFGLKKIG